MPSKEMLDFLKIKDAKKSDDFWRKKLSQDVMKNKDAPPEVFLKKIIDSKLNRNEAVLMSFHLAYILKTTALPDYDFVNDVIGQLEKQLPAEMVEKAKKRARVMADKYKEGVF